MPVGTQATVKSLTPGDLRTAGAQIILANTYHLSLRPGHERIARLGGLHRFMGWDGPILTDSGGYQVFSLAHLSRVDDDGVTFASHLDGSAQRLTPERAVEIQEALGGDIAMAFDQLVDATLPAARVGEAMARTHRWAERCLAARTRPDQALFGIVQGGVDPELRRQSVDAIAALPFDGIAIGGLSVGESKAQMADMLDVVGDALGDDPRRCTSRLLRRGGTRDRPLRLRPADPRGPQRTALDERRKTEPAQCALPGRPQPHRRRMRL
jgi:queuine tRNA-ribosyltransferase